MVYVNYFPLMNTSCRFLFRFYGDEGEINLAGDGVEPPEFSDWKWIHVDDVVERVSTHPGVL